MFSSAENISRLNANSHRQTTPLLIPLQDHVTQDDDPVVIDDESGVSLTGSVVSLSEVHRHGS